MDVDLDNVLSMFASAFKQDNRLFSLRFTDAALDSELLPHTLIGAEHVSDTFQFSVECLCSNVDLELKQLIGRGIDIAIHRDGDDRVLSGIVTRAQQLGADGGFARYGLTVEPAFSVLKLRRNSRVFQDKTSVEIVRIILDEHIATNPVFAQCFRHREQLTQNYLSCNYCQQYRESDFSFITRLLREEGISYYFDFEHGSDEIGLHTMVLFDAGAELNAAPHSSIRFHRADMTEDEDGITQWQAQRQIRSGRVSLASFDYKRVYTQQSNDTSTIDSGDSGSGFTASLDDYDPQSLSLVDGQHSGSSELSRYTTLRQQTHDLNGKTFSGSGVVRGLGAGQWFTLNDHPAHEDDDEADRQFVVLTQTIQARNNLPGKFETVSLAPKTRTALTLDEAGYQNTFQAVRKRIPIVPDYAHSEHAKPTARGIQTATVVGPAGEEIFTDELGRIKVQFHWPRAQDHDAGTHGASADRNDFSSCWVRVQMPSAGAQWGHQFIPRIGQEVLVDFIEGDIDRPIVTHAIHNGQQTPPTFQNAGSLPANKTLSGIKSHEYKGSRHNELIFDDTIGEIRTTLSTEHGKTQLNQGYLIHPRSEGKGTPRGEGFELRTDNAGALRSAQGLLVSTEAQANARGKQLDRSAAIAQLEAAQNLSQQFGDSAQNHRSNKPALDPALNVDQLRDKKPHVLMHGHGGVGVTTPQSITIATGKDYNQISQRDTHQTSGRRWIHDVAESASLFVINAQEKIKTSIKLIAAKGDVLIQAQSNDVEITADKKVTITACKENLTASASKEFLLQSGGGYIKISGGNIDIHCPGKLSIKAKSFVHEGGGGGSMAVPTMPSGDYNPIKPGIAGFDNTTFLGGVANGVLNQAAVVSSAFRKDGLTVQPFTGVVVSKPDQQDAKFNNLVGGMGGAVGRLTNIAAQTIPKGLGVGAIRGSLGERILTKTPLKHPAGESFNLPPSHAYNFIDATPKTLPQGTKIYRVVDDSAALNGGYWTETLPASKSEWRSGCAVLEDWNKNGSYIEYTVPEGGLNVWSGKAASQTLETAGDWIQPGGAQQLFVPSSKNQISGVLEKIPTKWAD